MDSLTITDLELWTHIGVPEEERAREQRVLVSVTLQLDTKAAAKSDDIDQSIDYEKLTNDVRELAQTERKTIERLAEDIANMILQTYQPEGVDVTVQKFVLPGTKDVQVSIKRP